MKKLIAEFIGTAALVFFGCGSAVLAGPELVGQLGIAFAFGLAIVAMAYGIGPISGCHVNPAVSFGAFISGRMSANEMVTYWAAQFLGALAGAGILYLIASGKAGYEVGAYGLGSNGFGEGYLGGYSMTAALVCPLDARASTMARASPTVCALDADTEPDNCVSRAAVSPAALPVRIIMSRSAALSFVPCTAASANPPVTSASAPMPTLSGVM